MNLEQEPDPRKAITWIKWYREKTGAGLAEAREIQLKKMKRYDKFNSDSQDKREE